MYEGYGKHLKFEHKSRYIVDLMNPIASGGFGVVYFGLSTSRADCGPSEHKFEYL